MRYASGQTDRQTYRSHSGGQRSSSLQSVKVVKVSMSTLGRRSPSSVFCYIFICVHNIVSDGPEQWDDMACANCGTGPYDPRAVLNDP